MSRTIAMMCGAIGVLIAGFALVDRAAGQTVRTDLEGTWDGVESRIGGREPRVFGEGELRLTFAGDSLRAVGFVEPVGRENSVAFTINAAATPKQFDYARSPGVTVPCLYEISGDKLTIAVPRRELKRPTAFDPESDAQILLVLKRRR